MYHRNPTLQKINNKITYILSRIVSPVVVIYAAMLFYDRYEILRYFDKADGRIIGANYDTPPFSKTGKVTISSVIEFTDQNFQRRIIHTRYSQTQSDEIDKSVAILYDPQNPDRAVVPDVLDFYLMPFLCLFIGLFMWWWGGLALNFKSPLVATNLKKR